MLGALFVLEQAAKTALQSFASRARMGSDWLRRFDPIHDYYWNSRKSWHNAQHEKERKDEFSLRCLRWECQRQRSHAVVAAIHWEHVRRRVRRNAILLYWPEQTQRTLCRPGGLGCAADKGAFAAEFS